MFFKLLKIGCFCSFFYVVAGSPDFLIIGSQKAGTTTLYDAMSQHPQIKSTKKKELHFFDWYFERGSSWYSKQFLDITDESNLITGEASVDYFFTPCVPERVYQAYPNIKLILILRDPVKRAVSQYKYAKHRGINLPSFNECIRQEIDCLFQGKEVDISNLNNGQVISGPDEMPELIVSSLGKGFIDHGLYIKHLKNWFLWFKKEQFLILNFDDYIKNPAMTLDQVFNFLEVKPYKVMKLSHHLSTEKIKIDIDKKILLDLKEYFAPFNLDLEHLLHKKFNW